MDRQQIGMERYRLTLVREPSPQPYGTQLLTASDVARVATEAIGDEAQEVFLAFHLDRRHRIRGMHEVSRGRIEATLVDMRIVFGGLLVAGQPALVVAHNHPSGEPSPSFEDRAITRRIAAAAELLDVEFLDHIVVTADGRFASLRKEGSI